MMAARWEHDREDLLAEATALVERIGIRLIASGSSSDEVFVGFRRDGSASVYFAAAPVYQFNRAGELRRAFVADKLYKAVRGRLIELTRHRTAAEVALQERELSPHETAALLDELTAWLNQLRSALAAGRYEALGQVPADVDVLARVKYWLAQQPLPPRIAASPRVG